VLEIDFWKISELTSSIESFQIIIYRFKFPAQCHRAADTNTVELTFLKQKKKEKVTVKKKTKLNKLRKEYFQKSDLFQWNKHLDIEIELCAEFSSTVAMVTTTFLYFITHNKFNSTNQFFKIISINYPKISTVIFVETN